MPNTRKTVIRALISAFNVHNYARNTVKTNFTLQSRGGKDYIVVSFDKSMDTYQCSEYLYGIKRKIVGEFYNIEEDTDERMLKAAKLIFDVNSLPFDISKGKWLKEQGRAEFVTPVDKGVILNLKSHLAASLAKGVLEDMPTCNFFIKALNKKGCLWHSEFPDKESRQQFEREFLFRMGERYENVPKNPLKVEGNSIYIKDVFDDARFIDSVTRCIAWLKGMGLQADSKVRNDVKAFKDLIIEFIDQSTGIIVDGFVCASPLDKEVASILIPIMRNGKGGKLLTKDEAHAVNSVFGNAVLNDIDGKVQGGLSINRSSGIYGIDFSNKEISHCVITKIIESSVINKDHELSIDPELHFQALSPSLPTPPGTPPNQRQERRDQALLPSLPTPPPSPQKKAGDCVAPSTSGGPRSLFEQPQTQRFPTGKSQGGVLKESPRQGFEEFFMSHKGTSEKFPPRTYISSATVVSEPSSSLQSVGAAQNVRAGTSAWSQPIGFWSPLAPSAEPSLWQPSRPSSWKGTNIDMSKWTSTLRSYSSPAPSAGLWSLPQSGPSSWKGANPVGANPWVQQTNHWSLQSSNLKEDCKKICEDFEEAYEKIVSDSSLSKEEQELFKELLYVFNLNNQILECHHTNFIVKNGKIASLINDGVNVKEYLQKVRDYTIKEYYRTEEKAKEACDLNEFPFKFLSNCEKNQETTVTLVANISRGALLNLKKLFIQEYEKEVEIEDIDINIVKKAVKSKKNEWVDSQVKKGMARPCEAIKTCYPDESVLESIPIIKGKDKYYLDRTFRTREVESFLKERRCAEGTSKAEKMKSEDNKDSGYSSGFVTDAENVSSKADAITSSGYESMDCENTREGSPKRTLELSMGMEELAISTELDATKTEQLCSPIKKPRSN